MKRNLSNIDRTLRVLAAAAFIYLYASGTVEGTLGLVLAIFGGVFLLTATVSFCPLYVPLKLSTCKKD
jgi:Protein of unknown function (DUF2892)